MRAGRAIPLRARRRQHVLTERVDALGFWQLVIAAALILLFRQTTLLSIRTGLLAPSSPRASLVIGNQLPEEVLDRIPDLAQDGIRYLLWLTSSCVVCSELASEVSRNATTPIYPRPVVALVAGEGDMADAISNRIKRSVDHIVRDPVALELASALGLEFSPFVVEVESGIVTGWNQVQTVADIWTLYEARSDTDAEDWVTRGLEGRDISAGADSQGKP